MKQGDDTKQRILKQADRLFYQQGFNATSIGHIVKATGLSKGNITYHFNTRQAILTGIVENRLKKIDRLLIETDAQYQSAVDRLIRFCEMLLSEEQQLVHYGCPMGTLTTELSKNQPTLYQITLPMFQRFLCWLTRQFIDLNFTEAKAHENAMDLLAKVQGISVITHVFKDKTFLNTAINQIKTEIHAKYDNNLPAGC